MAITTSNSTSVKPVQSFRRHRIVTTRAVSIKCCRFNVSKLEQTLRSDAREIEVPLLTKLGSSIHHAGAQRNLDHLLFLQFIAAENWIP